MSALVKKVGDKYLHACVNFLLVLSAMNTTRLFLGLIVLLLVGELSSCIDHRIPVVTPGVNRLRVKTITQQLTGNASLSIVSAFSYDNQNRLSSILAYQLPDSTAAPVELSVYQYDAQNRLTQLNRNTVRRGINAELYVYTYNGLGQVGNIMYRNNLSTSFGGTFSLSPTYNAVNRVTGAGKSYGTGGLIINEADVVTFTGNNLTAFSANSTGTGMGAPLPPQSLSVTFTHDSNVNPFYGVFVIPAPLVYAAAPSGIIPFYTYYGGIVNLFNLSQNNVLSAVTSSGATTTYAYTYNASNLPVTRITTVGGSVAEVLRYDYEPH